MKAYVAEKWCQPEELVFQELPDPPLAPGHILIDIKAAGMNFPDMLLIAGKYQMRPKRPFSPGAEVAGEVIAVADDVQDRRVGDRVMAVCWIGGYAERVAVPAQDSYLMPSNMSYEQAAGFIVTYQSSYFALRIRAQLQAGETVLVHGGAGGIGTASIQIAKAIGARVIATAGSDQKLHIAKQAGADEVLNYQQANWSKVVRKDLGGADVVIDPVGGDAFDKSVLCTNFEGRIVVVGFTSGRIAEVKTNFLLLNNISVMGLFWNLYQYNHPKQIALCMRELETWFMAGKLNPVIFRTYPLLQAPQALLAIASRQTWGKSILIP